MPLLKRKPPPSDSCLNAANQTPIPTYGQILLTLNLDLRREFQWVFVIAGIPNPILGADFLHHFKLLVDIRNQCLRDGLTNCVIRGSNSSSDYSSSASFIATTDDPYQTLLAEFPDLTTLQFDMTQTNYGTTHHIETLCRKRKVQTNRKSPPKYTRAHAACN